MNTVNMTASVRKGKEGVAIVDIFGEVTGFSEAALTEAYNKACSDAARAVVLNFSGLEYMNSSGIGLLVMLLIRAQRLKQRLLACGLSEHYRQIFELTRLNEAIGIYPNEAEALSSVA
jgi:anti-sigma B factor antagonist